MNEKELTKNVEKIKQFLTLPDYNKIDAGIELVRALDESAVFEALLGGWFINDEGILILEKGYKGETLTKRWSDESWPYFAYALVNLIGYAPKNTKVHKSLKLSNIIRLDFNIDSGVLRLDNHFSKLPSVLSKFTNLTHLDLGSCKSLQNVDVLANLTNLTSLNLYSCSSLQNVDVLANLTNLTSLNLRNSDKVHPKPSIEGMTTREEVAAYQDKIRNPGSKVDKKKMIITEETEVESPPDYKIDHIIGTYDGEKFILERTYSHPVEGQDDLWDRTDIVVYEYDGDEDNNVLVDRYFAADFDYEFD